MRGGKWSEAKAFYEARIKTNPDDVSALYYAALARENLGDWKVAQQLYARVLTLSPYHAESLTNLSAHAVESGDYAGARSTLEPAMGKPGPACPLVQNYALALAGLDDPRANVARDTALKCDPKAGMFRVYYAQLRALKHKEEAIASLVQLPDVASSDLIAMQGGLSTLRALGAYRKCIDYSLALFNIQNPYERPFGPLWVEVGLCQIGVKDEQEAQRAFEYAVRSDPSLPDAHFYLAGVQARARYVKEPIASYTKFLELAPKDPRAEQARARINALSRSK